MNNLIFSSLCCIFILFLSLSFKDSQGRQSHGRGFTTQNIGECNGSGFKEINITKGSGNTIKVYQTLKTVLVTWFEAAFCCEKMGLNLQNINNEKDAEGYYNYASKTFHRYPQFYSWTDVHGYSDKWRNLKGVYPTGKIYEETPERLSNTKGLCRQFNKVDFRDPSSGTFQTKLRLTWMPCSDTHAFRHIYCETDDPAIPKFNYNCDSIVNKELVNLRIITFQKYYETILSANCENQTKMIIQANTTPSTTTPTATTPTTTTTTTPTTIVTLVPVVNSPIPVLTSCTIYVSETMASWDDAIKSCKEKSMLLMVIPTEKDNQFLNQLKIFKHPPYSAATHFWSGAKFHSTHYDTETLMWESWNKAFPHHYLNDANGITKWWALGEPHDDDGKGIELCIDIMFPGNSPPVWFVSTCSNKYFYICVQNPDERDPLAECEENETSVDNNEETTTPSTPTTTKTIIVGPPYICGEDPNSNGECEEQKSTTRHYTPLLESEGTFHPDEISHLPPGHPYAYNITGVKDNKTNIVMLINKPFKCGRSIGSWIPKIINPHNIFSILHGSLEPHSKFSDPQNACKEMIFWKDIYLAGVFIPDDNINWPIYGSMTQDEHPLIFIANNPDNAIIQNTVGTWKPEPSYNYLLSIHGTMKPVVLDDEIGTAEFIPDDFIMGTFTVGGNSTKIPGKLTQGRPQLFVPSTPPNVNSLTCGIWTPTVGVVPNYPFSNTHGCLKPWENDPSFTVFIPENNIPVQFTPGMKRPSESPTDPAEPINGTVTQDNPPIFKPLPNPFKTCEEISGTIKTLTNAPDIFHGVLTPVDCTGNNPQSFKITPEKLTNGVFIPANNSISPINGTLTDNEPCIFTLFVHSSTPSIPKQVIPGTWKPQKKGQSIRGHLEPTPYQYYYFIPDRNPPGHFIIVDGELENHIIIKGNLSGAPPYEFTPIDKTKLPSVSTVVVWVPENPDDRDNPFGKEEIKGILQPPDDNENDDTAIFVPDETVHGQIIVDGQPPQFIKGSLVKIKRNTTEPQPQYVFTPETEDDLPPKNFTKPISGTWVKAPPTSTKYPYSALHGTFVPDPKNPNTLIFTPDPKIMGEFTNDDRKVIPGSMTQSSPITFIPNSPINISNPMHGFWKTSVGHSPTTPFTGVYGTLKTGSGNGVIVFEPDSEVTVVVAQIETSVQCTAIMVQGNPPIIKPSKPLTNDSKFPVTIISQNLSVNGILDPAIFHSPNRSSSIFAFVAFSWARMEFYPEVYSNTPMFSGTFTQGSKPLVKPDHNQSMQTPIKGMLKPDLESLKNHPIKFEFYLETIYGELKPVLSMPENNIMIFIPNVQLAGIMIFTIEKERTPAPGNLQPDEANPLTQPSIFIANPSIKIAYKIDVVWKPNEGAVIKFGKLTPNPFNSDILYFFPDLPIKGQFTPESVSLNPINGSMINSNPPIFFPDDKTQNISAEIGGMWKPEVEDEDFPFGSPQLGVLKPTNFDKVGIVPVWEQKTVPPEEGCSGRFYPDSNINSIHGHLIKPNTFILTNSDQNINETISGNWLCIPEVDPGNPFSQPGHGIMKPEGGNIIWVPDSDNVCNKPLEIKLVC